MWCHLELEYWAKFILIQSFLILLFRVVSVLLKKVKETCYLSAGAQSRVPTAVCCSQGPEATWHWSGTPLTKTEMSIFQIVKFNFNNFDLNRCCDQAWEPVDLFGKHRLMSQNANHPWWGKSYSRIGSRILQPNLALLLSSPVTWEICLKFFNFTELQLPHFWNGDFFSPVEFMIGWEEIFLKRRCLWNSGGGGAYTFFSCQNLNGCCPGRGSRECMRSD